MRYTQAEKLEIIHLVETSDQPVKRTLAELGVPRSTFYDLITSPAFELVKARDRFEHPPQRVNELWQTDFTQFKVVSWGWYYLCTVLDDFSRYILAWRLSLTMAATDVQETLLLALEQTGVEQVKVHHSPRLLSDNGPAFIAGALADFLKPYDIDHIRGRAHHPQTQGRSSAITAR